LKAGLARWPSSKNWASIKFQWTTTGIHTNQSVSGQVETAILLEIGRQTVIDRLTSNRFRRRKWSSPRRR
jgi:hypothetical protein